MRSMLMCMCALERDCHWFYACVVVVVLDSKRLNSIGSAVLIVCVGAEFYSNSTFTVSPFCAYGTLEH